MIHVLPCLLLPLLAPADSYLGRPIATTMHWLGAEWLIREEREAEEHVSRLVELLELEPGDRVCDLGAGNGALSLPIARAVGPAGRVWAVDIQQPMLDLLEQRAREEGVPNVTCVLGREADFDLPAETCDLVLMVDVYHELSDPARMLAHVAGVLAPGGRLCLAEYRLEDPQVPIKRLHRMSQAQIVRELAENGYRHVAGPDDLPRQHLEFFVHDLFAGLDGDAGREPLVVSEFLRGWRRALGSGDARLLAPFHGREVRLRGTVGDLAARDAVRAVPGSDLARALVREARPLAPEARREAEDAEAALTRLSGSTWRAVLELEALGRIELELARDDQGALEVLGLVREP